MIRQFMLCGAVLSALLTQPVFAGTCIPALSASHLVAAGKLQMSINPTLPPQQYIDDKGELQGLNVELGRRMPPFLQLTPLRHRAAFKFARGSGMLNSM